MQNIKSQFLATIISLIINPPQAKRRKVEADVEFSPRAHEGEEGNMRAPTFKEKLYYYYTSPVIKFFFNTGTYLIFLILYGSVPR